MRFDLTNASYRVLDRAAKRRLPTLSSEIGSARLLIALFEEDECRAADWLAAAGLSLEKFQRDFSLETTTESTAETMVLESPISAPGFPVGDYGVPAGLYQGTASTGTPQIAASPAGSDAPPVGYPEPEERTIESKRHEEKRQHPSQEPDEWKASETNDSSRGYSIHPRYRNDLSGKPRQSRCRFLLDDAPVQVGRISVELEEVLEIIVHRLARPGASTRKIPGAGGGITSVVERNAEYFPPFSLATEHLLLAVLLAEGDAGQWLRDNGFDATELYRRIEEIGAEMPETDRKPVDMPDDLLADQSVSKTVSEPVDDRIHRLLDAAINRAREAVRVVEDYVRFVLDDGELTRQLKDFRHRFQEISQEFSDRRRLDARNTREDVGTEIEGRGEYFRSTPRDVLAANFARLQESLRSLEEFSKLVAPELSRRYEKLRYRCYSLHKAVCLAEPVSETISDEKSNHAAVELDAARLYALVDCRADEAEFSRIVTELANGGVDVIQLRDKRADDRTLLDRARILKRIFKDSKKSVLFVMNDRPDLARLAGADGVHVGQEELTVADVRRIVGSEMLVGVSTHNMEQAHRAVADGADYIGAGPVFESSTKEFTDFAGPDFLRQVAAEIGIPAFAIGGISSENLDQVLDTGIRRIAVGSALLDAADCREAAEELCKRLELRPAQSEQ